MKTPNKKTTTGTQNDRDDRVDQKKNDNPAQQKNNQNDQK